MRLQGKVAIVTGGGSGIGRASALLFAREGARVVVADFDAAAGAETAQAVCAQGGEAAFVPVDVADWRQVSALVERTVELYGGVDVLFNNAGVLVFGNVLETPIETWNRVMAINLTGVYLCCRAAIPVMAARGGGSIIDFWGIGTTSPRKWVSSPESQRWAMRFAKCASWTSVGAARADSRVMCSAG